MSSKLVQVLARKGLSDNAAARLIGPDKKTIARWLAGKSRMNVELVLDSPLGEDFRRALCTHDHSETAHVDAPHVARSKARVSKKKSVKTRKVLR